MSNHPLGAPEDFPQRPNTDDFYHLSDIVLMLDAAADPTDPTIDVEKAVAERFEEMGIDQESVVYMATQRAMRAVGANDVVSLALNSRLIAKIAGIWIDAFSAGVHMERKYGL